MHGPHGVYTVGGQPGSGVRQRVVPEEDKAVLDDLPFGQPGDVDEHGPVLGAGAARREPPGGPQDLGGDGAAAHRTAQPFEQQAVALAGDMQITQIVDRCLGCLLYTSRCV